MDFRYDEIQGHSVMRRQSIFSLLKVATRRQTYFNLAYLIAAFPLGLFYFVFLVNCFSVGVGTAIIGVGLRAADRDAARRVGIRDVRARTGDVVAQRTHRADGPARAA